MKPGKACLFPILFLLFGGGASAGKYRQHFGNEASFETLEEARLNAPALLAEWTGRTYVPDPALDAYPAGTTFVYRSARMFTDLSAAARMNTNILVYTDRSFANRDAALAFLEELGLTGIIGKAYGSVVLVTPIDKEKGFGLADQTAYYQLQSAMCNVGYSRRAEGKLNHYADSAWYGGVTYRYLVGLDGGATFINNYVAGTFDYITRIAGVLLVGGNMERIREVASFVPAYLVNAPGAVVAKYRAANATDAWGTQGDLNYYFNQARPLQRVIVASGNDRDVRSIVRDAYDRLFTKAMRVPVAKANLHTASTPYADYNFNAAPYSLGARNAITDGVTADKVHVVERQEERFKDMAAPSGEYLDTWYELLPEEVKNNTAPRHSIPLVLANHGGGDDPLQYLDEIGLVQLAGEKRIAVVAPFHSNVTGLLSEVLPELVRYMLDAYPALDPSRVYCTGYSMGGRAAMAALSGDAGVFAAAVAQGAVTYLATEEQEKQYADIDIPILFTTSTYDFHMDEATLVLRLSYYFGMKAVTFDYTTLINQYLGYNGMEPVRFDFAAHPMSGFKGDTYERVMLNNEYATHTWMIHNRDGVPMVGLNVTEFLPHGLYQEYAGIFWNFAKHYSRNLETGEVVYNPFVE